MNKGDEIQTSDRKYGVVLEDADDRQGYFWTRFGMLVFNLDPKREDICVPFAAIETVKSVAFGQHRNIRLTLSRDEVEQLPQRWQMQRQPTVQELVRSLPMMDARGHAARPALPLPVSGTVVLPGSEHPAPAADPNPFANLALSAKAQTLVAEQFRKSADIITEMAKIEQMTQSEAVSEGIKEIAHQETVNAYQRLQAINQWTDMEISRVLQHASQQAALANASAMEGGFISAMHPEGGER